METLSGRRLRYVVLEVLLDAGGPMPLAAISATLAAQGIVAKGTSSGKTLADALGHECARGRARRVARGVYSVNALGRSMKWRIRKRAADVRRGNDW